MTESCVLRLIIVFQPLTKLFELVTRLGYIWSPEEPLLQLVRYVPVLGEELVSLHPCVTVTELGGVLLVSYDLTLWCVPTTTQTTPVTSLWSSIDPPILVPVLVGPSSSSTASTRQLSTQYIVFTTI